MSFPPLVEWLFFALLLLGVGASYFALKLHYIFAFGLMRKTKSYPENSQKIEKIRTIVLQSLQILFILGFIAMFLFCTIYLYEGYSLHTLALKWWAKIPEGFWLFMILTLIKIAILIIIFRFILGKLYAILDAKEIKTLTQNRYQSELIKLFYARVHKSLKFTVILGIVYRITHFFPFLSLLSTVIGVILLVYLLLSLLLLGKAWHKMRYSELPRPKGRSFLETPN